MKLIIGLGNPGKKYEKTWHNLGFVAAGKIAENLSAKKLQLEKKFQAEIAVTKTLGEKIIIAKPQTFMNESGRAVALIANYYKIGRPDIIVIHDDLDLPLGKIRLTKNSSAGGHNGVRSIIETLSGQDFIRVKIGVATEKTKKIGTADYVLNKIGFWDSRKSREATENAAKAAIALLSEPIEKVMNDYN
jgi:peptidyl-tRNA hydrolase, PTH1 family